MTSTRHRSGPQLSADATRKIESAVFVELADHGYASLSMDGVARRAGVGKAAIYRRWAGKREMVVQLVADRAAGADLFPDTGTLRGDLIEWLSSAREQLSDPLISRIAAEMVALTARDPEMARTMFEHIGAVRRRHAVALLRRGIDRGELPNNLDLDLACDLVPGPIYWRLAVSRRPLDDTQLAAITDMVIAGLRAVV